MNRQFFMIYRSQLWCIKTGCVSMLLSRPIQRVGWSFKNYSTCIGGACNNVHFKLKHFCAIMKDSKLHGLPSGHFSTLLAVQLFQITDQFRIGLKFFVDMAMMSLETSAHVFQHLWQPITWILGFAFFFCEGIWSSRSIMVNHTTLQSWKYKVAAIPAAMFQKVKNSGDRLHECIKFVGRHVSEIIFHTYLLPILPIKLPIFTYRLSFIWFRLLQIFMNSIHVKYGYLVQATLYFRKDAL